MVLISFSCDSLTQDKPLEFVAGTDQCDIWEVDKDPRTLIEGHEVGVVDRVSVCVCERESVFIK